MSSPHSPLHIVSLVVNLVIVVLATMVAFTTLARQYGFPEAIPGLLHSDLEEVSDMHPSPISPPAWTNSIWVIVLLLQVAWSFHSFVSIFRNFEGYPVYANPPLISPLLLLIFIFACGFNISWFIFYDRFYTSTSVLFIFLTTSAVWSAYGIALAALFNNFYRMEKSLQHVDILLTRILVHNGLALYAMWTIFAFGFNVSVALIHNIGHHMNAIIATVCGATIIGTGMLIYFVVDIACLDYYSRYVFSPHIISIIVLASCLFRQEIWDSHDVNFILLATLLCFALVAFMMKSAFVAYRAIKNDTGTCDITTKNEAAPVDEAYYLLQK